MDAEYLELKCISNEVEGNLKTLRHAQVQIGRLLTTQQRVAFDLQPNPNNGSIENVGNLHWIQDTSPKLSKLLGSLNRILNLYEESLDIFNEKAAGFNDQRCIFIHEIEDIFCLQRLMMRHPETNFYVATVAGMGPNAFDRLSKTFLRYFRVQIDQTSLFVLRLNQKGRLADPDEVRTRAFKIQN